MSLKQQQISSAPSIKTCLVFSIIHFSSLVSVQQNPESPAHQGGAASGAGQNQEIESQWNKIKQAGAWREVKFSGIITKL